MGCGQENSNVGCSHLHYQLRFTSLHFASKSDRKPNTDHSVFREYTMSQMSFLWVTVFFIHACSYVFTVPLPLTGSKCHEEERSALLEFKYEFFNESRCYPYFDSPKLESWNGEDRDCCAWEGVECDKRSGHVISLDLERSCLYGSINSKASLFRFVHLRRLNLAGNYFESPRIPPAIGNLHALTSLDLSYSFFASQIPMQVLKLTNLSYLDLSGNYDLELKNPNMSSLFQSLTKLEHLDMSYVPMATSLLDAITNLSSLRSLILEECHLQGELPIAIFNLPWLEVLNLSDNEELFVNMPEFYWSIPLKSLSLVGIKSVGQLPTSLGNLTSLTELYITYSGLSGRIPSSIGQLTHLNALDLNGNELIGEIPSSLGNLVKLTYMDLSYNQLSGEIPLSLGNLVKLVYLGLSYNKLSGKIPLSLGKLLGLTHLDLSSNQLLGEIPLSLGNLVGLTHLDLSVNQLSGETLPTLMKLNQLTFFDVNSNQLAGEIPPQIEGLTQATKINLSFNKLHGLVPETISKLSHLNYFGVVSNNLNGIAPLDVFFQLESLHELYLSFNNFSSISMPQINSSLSNIVLLGLASCNIDEFPRFLTYLDKLEWLDLSHNSLHGKIPLWFFNVSTEHLAHLNLSNNYLMGFRSYAVDLKWPNLGSLDLRYNVIEGQLPIPPPSILFYLISNNKLSGEIPLAICQLSSIVILDLAKNQLTGVLPSCLNNLSDSLSILSFHDNEFYGQIPQLQRGICKLVMVDLSDNRLQGPLPWGLNNCIELEFLNFGNNKIVDTFPSWLGSLPNLKVLILHSNGFHGVIREPEANHHQFPKLHIIDLSMNNFTSNLPYDYFTYWSAMKVTEIGEAVYYAYPLVSNLNMSHAFTEYDYSIKLISKGVEMEYVKILEYLIVIDFSSNNFIGEIPYSLGSLKGLHLLNLSNNAITGSIPLSLQNLTELEALDLSGNKLSGEIPLELTQLTFLEFFNISNNNLSGPIPRGNQFSTFKIDSYMGNLGLCGPPLIKKCENLEVPPPTTIDVSHDEDSSTWIEKLDWKIVMMGFASGLVVGVIKGQDSSTRIQHWFERKLHGHKRRRPRRKTRFVHCLVVCQNQTPDVNKLNCFYSGNNVQTREFDE